MARAFNGSNQWLAMSSVNILAYPMTVAGWLLPASAHIGAMWSVGQVNDDLHWMRVALHSDGAAKLSMRNTSLREAVTTNTYTAGAWTHLCGRATSSTNRTCVLNGDITNQGSNTTSTSYPVGATASSLGRHEQLNPGAYFNGRIALVAQWDASLSDAEVVALAARANPRDIRPANLISYWFVDGRFSPERDLIGNFNLTVTGATYEDNPRGLIKRAANILLPWRTAVGGATNPGWVSSSRGWF